MEGGGGRPVERGRVVFADADPFDVEDVSLSVSSSSVDSADSASEGNEGDHDAMDIDEPQPKRAPHTRRLEIRDEEGEVISSTNITSAISRPRKRKYERVADENRVRKKKRSAREVAHNGTKKRLTASSFVTMYKNHYLSSNVEGIICISLIFFVF